MPSDPKLPFTAATMAAALALLGACTEAEPTMSGPFEASGEIIALSGGDAGAEGACVICHGLSGEGDGNYVPRLAGMDRGYFLRQMENFSEGLRRHPQMVWVADHMDWPARQKLAVHYEALPWPERSQDLRLTPVACAPQIEQLYLLGDPERGIASCASCHGEDGMGVGHGNPALAGQPGPYIAEQLRKWRSGERHGDPQNVMLEISVLLEEAELDPLGDYISALRDPNSSGALREACLRTRRPGPRSDA